MISSFENYLKYNSPADEWFRELNTEGMTWKTLEKGFLECFPPIQKAKKLELELERELCKLRLKVDKLGKKEKYAGEEVWSHVAFAEKALSLVRQVKIDKGSNSIWTVCDELLEIIHKVKETYTTWNEFCTAIKEVDMSHICDGMKKHQKEKEEKERVESMIVSLRQAQQQQQHHQQLPTVPLSPMSNVSNAMQSTTIRNTQPALATTANTALRTAMANTNPFATSSTNHCLSPMQTMMRSRRASHTIPCSPIHQTAIWHGWPNSMTGGRRIGTASLQQPLDFHYIQGEHPQAQGNAMAVAT